MRIAYKISLLVMFTALFATAVCAWIGYSEATHQYVGAVDRQLTTAAAALPRAIGTDYLDRALAGEAPPPEQYDRLVDTLNGIADRSDIYYLYVFAQDGDRIVHLATSASMAEREAGDWPPFGQPYEQPPAELLSTFADGRTRFAEYSDEFGTFRSIFVRHSGANGRPYVVGVDQELSRIHADLRTLVGRYLGAGALVALLTGALGIAVALRITRPLQALVNHLTRIGEGRLDERIELNENLEMVRLSAAINDTVEKLRDRMALLKAQEELRRERAAAEGANKAKSAFLASMSHELRTPMNAIIGYSEMLIEDAEDLEHETFVSDLKKVHGAGMHLLALINDILDLSKIEAGRMELFCETFDLDPLIDDVVSTVDTLVKKNNNELAVERDESLGAMHADLTKIRQMLFNFISNAAKFTENGTITLSAHREADGADEWIVFGVADTGIGIAEDKIDSLFGEFTQADASTTRNYGGTGLGLAITKRFAEMMHGSIRVESTLGEGSSFTIRLPAVVQSPAEGAEEAMQEEDAVPGGEGETTPTDAELSPDDQPVPSGVSGSRRRVLVIDDDADARDLMSRMLTKDAFEVVTAPDGQEGLRLALEQPPDAITLDVMMPSVDGWAVLQQLKTEPRLQDIPVIMVSMIAEKQMSYTLGATDHLTKPVDRRRLAELLDRHRCGDPPCKALLVEDDEEVREIMQRSLVKAGWSVTEASNGQEGLDRLRDATPTLILLDLMMPIMDGFEFLLELRKVAAWRSIPVIVVTAKNLTAEERRRLRGDIEQIIEKSGSSCEALIKQVRDAVTSCSPASA